MTLLGRQREDFWCDNAVPDLKAFPEKEIHEQKDGDSFLDSMLPTSEKVNGPYIKPNGVKAAASSVSLCNSVFNFRCSFLWCVVSEVSSLAYVIDIDVPIYVQDVTSSAYTGSNVRQARYRPMVSPQGQWIPFQLTAFIYFRLDNYRVRLYATNSNQSTPKSSTWGVEVIFDYWLVSGYSILQLWQCYLHLGLILPFCPRRLLRQLLPPGEFTPLKLRLVWAVVTRKAKCWRW